MVSLYSTVVSANVTAQKQIIGTAADTLYIYDIIYRAEPHYYVAFPREWRVTNCPVNIVLYVSLYVLYISAAQEHTPEKRTRSSVTPRNSASAVHFLCMHFPLKWSPKMPKL